MLLSFRELKPKLASDVFVAGSARVIGDTRLGQGVSIWFGAVLRGDINRFGPSHVASFRRGEAKGASVHSYTYLPLRYPPIGGGAGVVPGVVSPNGSRLSAWSPLPGASRRRSAESAALSCCSAS